VFDFSKRLISEYDGAIDWERIDGLLEEFLDSEEGKPYRPSGTHWVPLVIEYALRYEVAKLPEIDRRVMQIVLFGLFPEKVSMAPEAAPEAIRETRAFWTFLQRQYGLKNAAGVLALLDPGAEGRLRKELADPSNYGMAKSFVMAGEAAGFDMTTQEGMNEFMAVYNARLGLPPMPPAGALPGPDDDFDFGDADDEDDPHPDPSHSPKERAEMRKKKRKANKKKRK